MPHANAPSPPNASWFKVLVAEFERGQLESGLFLRAVRERGPLVRLVRALVLVQLGDDDRARADVAAVLHDAPGSGAALLVAGVIHYILGEYDEALRAAERASALAPALTRKGHWFALLWAARLGWTPETRRALEALLAAEPASPDWGGELARLLARGRDDEGALAHAQAQAVSNPGSARARMLVAAALMRVGRAVDAARAVESALSLHPPTGETELDGARLLTEIGAFDAAREHLARAVKLDHGSAPALAALARFTLWSGDDEGAVVQARRALALDAGCAAAWRTLGAVSMDRGHLPEAATSLERACSLEPGDAEALLLRADVARRQGDFEGARRAIDQALSSTTDHHVSASILQVLLSAMRSTSPTLARWPFAEIAGALGRICPEEAATLDASDRDRVREALETALRRMHGNRSATCTFQRAGELHLLGDGTSPRVASRRALGLVELCPPERVLRELDSVIRRFPGSSLPVCHRGELHLWLGDLAAARADFERAIAFEPCTRFAYVGLTGVDMLEGRLAEALEVCARGVRVMKDTEGPAVFVYRGEVLRRLGRHDEAVHDLTRAVEHSPGRLSAWINLGLVPASSGDDPGALKCFEHVRRRAPGLISDAARETGTHLHRNGAPAPAREARRRILAHALEMMRGNRSSSCLTYFTREGKLRLANPQSPRAPAPHDTDAHDVGQALGLLFDEFGRRPRH
jgi:tetratricopeptide (TPR) repeat protein